MAFKRPGLQAHQEHVNTVKSLYLKTSDFEKQRRFRPLFWKYGEDVIDILFYQEGWHIPDDIDPKTKKLKYPNGRPVRFPAEAEAASFPQLNWKMESYGGGQPRPATPKSAVSMLVWDYESNELKIVSFTQKSVLKAINEYLSPTNEDGSDNAAYIENLTSTDFVVKKIDDRTWNINVKEGNPKIPLEAFNAIKQFQFSWDKFMACESDMEDAPILADFLEDVEGNIEVETPEEQKKRIDKANEAKAKANKNVSTSSPAKESAKSTVVQTQKEDLTTDWRNLKTAKGTSLGEMGLEKLKGLVAWFEKEKADTCQSSKLYQGALQGIAELDAPAEPEEPEVSEDAPW